MKVMFTKEMLEKRYFVYRNCFHRTCVVLFCISFQVRFSKHNPLSSVALAVVISYAAGVCVRVYANKFHRLRKYIARTSTSMISYKMLSGHNFTRKFISSAFIHRSFWHTETNEGKQLLNHAISWDLLSLWNVQTGKSSFDLLLFFLKLFVCRHWIQSKFFWFCLKVLKRRVWKTKNKISHAIDLLCFHEC